MCLCCCCSVTKLCPTLQTHGLQHTRLPYPSLSPRVCSNSYPLSQWSYLTISPSAALFSFCFQSSPASGSFPVSRLYVYIFQSLSCVQLFATTWTARLPCPLSTPGACSNSCPLSRWCHPTNSSSVIPFSSCLQYFSASGSFPMIGSLPKYWSFSFSISPSNEYSVLISFRIDWLDLLAVQGILKSRFQHHSSKASILQHSALWFNSHIHIWPLEKP